MSRVIPRFIDDPPPILAWRADDILPMGLGLMIGIVIEQIAICVVVGWISTRFYRRMRESTPDGWLRHKLYEIGAGKQTRIMPDPTIKYFK